MSQSLPERLSVFVALGGRLSLSLMVFGLYSVLVGAVVSAWELKSPDWTAEVTAGTSLVLGLLMNFRNRVAYDRWWEARKLWGQFVNDVRNLVAKLAAYLTPEVLTRSRVAVLVSAFPEALKRHLQGEAVRLRDLAGFESATGEPAHVPFYLAGRLYARMAEWRREGLLSETLMLILDPHLRAWMDVCGACERIRNTPLSPSYIALLRINLILNLLIAPWFALAVLGWYGLPVLMLGCLFLLGIELIDATIEEPFGREREDLDLGRYVRTMQEAVREGIGNRE